jgi:AcrR family transcriptional regulator
MTVPFPAGGLPAAKLRLLQEAEYAFGEHGIANSSLREISERAGHRNRTAVQYHFGDRDGLVLAILRHRRPQIDALRARFFAALGTGVEEAPSELLVEAIIGPLLFTNLDVGLQPYARTVYALLHYDIDGSIWRRTGDAAPLTRSIYSALRVRAGSVGDREWQMRQTAFGRCCIDMAAHRSIMFPGSTLADPETAFQLVAMLCAMLLVAAPDGDGPRGFRTNCEIWRTIAIAENGVKQGARSRQGRAYSHAAG